MVAVVKIQSESKTPGSSELPESLLPEFFTAWLNKPVSPIKQLA